MGVPSILRYIARAGPSTSGLYGSDALSACQVRLAPVLRALGEAFAADSIAHKLLQLSPLCGSRPAAAGLQHAAPTACCCCAHAPLSKRVRRLQLCTSTPAGGPVAGHQPEPGAGRRL